MGKVGDLALQFKDGGWTSTDTAGNSRTLMAPSARPDTSLADAAEIDRVKKENEALRGENNLLKFKIELLVEMLTVANLEDEKGAAESERDAAVNDRSGWPPRRLERQRA